MATPETLLSVKDGEKLQKVDANTEDGAVQEVGGPESDWSTANYANFKFDAAVGVSPDSTILPDAQVDAEKVDTLKEEDEPMDAEKKDSMEVSEQVCPACGNSPCSCDGVKEQETPQMSDEKPADEPALASEAENDVVSDTDEDDAMDVEDDTLELDLSDLVDDEEEVVELDSAPEEVSDDEDEMELGDMNGDEENDFMASESDAMWSDDEKSLKVDVEEQDAELPVDDEKKDELMSEEDGEEMKKDDKKEDEKMVAEEEDEDMKKDDEKEKKDAEPMAEGKLRISFKMTEATKLFENNEVLTEADKRQSRALFESAVRSVAKQIGQQLQEAYQARYEQAKKQHEEKVSKQVDQYLSYVVEQWAKDNKVALQNQLRNRLSESFITGLQKLFTEHYIDVPQSKVNVVEALAKNVKALKTRLKESEAKAVKLHTEAKEAITRERLALRKEHKARLIAEAASAVTSSDRGAFVERAETVKFTNTKEFKTTLVALREQYFGAKKSTERSTNEPVAAPNFETKKAPSAIDVYAQAVERLTGRS